MKTFPSLFVALLCAGATLDTQAWSQDVYKCGNTYSQIPCPGAVAIDANDARTPAQKAQTDAAAAQAARSADKLEKDRLALEKRLAGKPSPKTLQSDQTAAAAKPGRPVAKANASTRKKDTTPDYFTAAVAPDTKKEKKTPGKSGQSGQAASPGKTTGP